MDSTRPRPVADLHSRIDMARPPNYPGEEKTNLRYKNTRMHVVGWYDREHTKKLGIYSDAVDVFVKHLHERIKNHQQNVIVVDGDTGSGKSTFAIQLCYKLAKMQKVKFDLHEDYIYSLGDLMKKLDGQNENPISLFDEGSLLLNSKSSQRREDMSMVALFDTMRSRGWTTVICIPSINQLNKTVRTVHADFLCHCSSPNKPLIPGYGRGFVEISYAKRSQFAKGDDPYWYLCYTGVFKELPEDVDSIYQPIKRHAQDVLIKRIIKRNNEIIADEDEE